MGQVVALGFRSILLTAVFHSQTLQLSHDTVLSQWELNESYLASHILQSLLIAYAAVAKLYSAKEGGMKRLSSKIPAIAVT